MQNACMMLCNSLHVHTRRPSARADQDIGVRRRLAMYQYLGKTLIPRTNEIAIGPSPELLLYH